MYTHTHDDTITSAKYQFSTSPINGQHSTSIVYEQIYIYVRTRNVKRCYNISINYKLNSVPKSGKDYCQNYEFENFKK